MMGAPHWVTSESDVKNRPGWFYHDYEDDKVMNVQTMFDRYFTTVGRNSLLLFNVPPNQHGMYHENDVQALKDFSQVYNQTFAVDLTQYGVISASSSASNMSIHNAMNVLNDDFDSYWASGKEDTQPILTIMFDTPIDFDIVEIQEYIKLGQRVQEYSIEIQIDGSWYNLESNDQFIGYKRLHRYSPSTASGMRLIFTQFLGDEVVLNGFSIYKAAPEIEI